MEQHREAHDGLQKIRDYLWESSASHSVCRTRIPDHVACRFHHLIQRYMGLVGAVDPNKDEPNNTQPEAGVLALPAIHFGYLGYADDVLTDLDFFQVHLTQNQHFVASIHGDVSCWLRLADDAGNVVSGGKYRYAPSNLTGEGTQISFTAPYDGTWYLGIAQTESFTGGYPYFWFEGPYVIRAEIAQ